VVGYTSTTLPGGAGNLFAPAFINSNSFVGVLSEVDSAETSTLTVSGDLEADAFNESVDVDGVSKGYPLYYVEVLNDTNDTDGIDTEGLIIDVVSNTASTLLVAAETADLGIQGDESIAVRKHLTLGDIFSGSTGLSAYTDSIAIYNEDGPGTVVSHLPDGDGGFVLSSDFVTVSTDAPVYPGTGIVINNPDDVTITPCGTVKETDTQVVLYGGSVVNVVGVLSPISSYDVDADGRLNEALADYTDACNIYSQDGTLVPTLGFLDDGENGFVSSADFVTPVSPSIDGTSQPIVITAGVGTVYKISGVSID
jgi:hypothetical protein